MYWDGEDPNTNTSALLWVEVEAHLHVVAGVDAGILDDRLAMPAQLVYGWRVLESVTRSWTAPRFGSVSGVIETSSSSSSREDSVNIHWLVVMN